ncbi:MAG: NAD-binding protein [Candidatus Micrarchaeota archaeon]|nr:NAD-binding protein [Candidatus Micrarchaeota archaeon]
MVNLKRTQYTLILIVAVLFLASLALSVAAGVGLWTAIIENSLDSLQVSFYLVNFSEASNPLFFISKLLDATIFPLLTVLLASWFFDFINNFNLRERIISSRINNLRGHVIIVPYNSFSKVLSEDLKKQGIKSVTIAQNQKELRQLYRENGLAINGDLRSAEVFRLAGIDRARCVIACSKDDMQNALVSITAKTAHKDIDVIVRANKEDNADRLEKAGAYKTVLAEETAGTEIGNEIVKRLVSKKSVKGI